MADELKQRAAECRDEVFKVLEKYNCYPDVFVEIGTNGKVNGRFEVVAKEVPPESPKES